MAACSGCANEWTAQTLCHCGGCHRTFHSLVSFDRHRNTMKGRDGTCLDPVSVGLRLRKRGTITAWGAKGEGTVVRGSKIDPVTAGKTGQKTTNATGVGS